MWTSVGKNQDCRGGEPFFCPGQQKKQTVLLMGRTSLHYLFAVDCTDIQGCYICCMHFHACVRGEEGR